MYLQIRLHDRDRKIRSYTLFFRLNEILLTNKLTRETIKPIPIEKTAQLTEQSISIREREKRSRQWDAATTEQEAIYVKPLIVNAMIGEMAARVFINLGC
jgi:hypothetical protein